MQDPPRAAPLKPDRVAGSASANRQSIPNPQSIRNPQSAIRDVMWRSVGLFRDRAGLEHAVAALDSMAAASQPPTVDGARHRNLATVARLIARAALRRTESRGGHFRSDFPARDDVRWKKHVVDERAPVADKDTKGNRGHKGKS